MKKLNILYLSVVILVVVSACKPSLDKSKEKIAKIEKEIFAPNAAFDSVKAIQLINMYIDFADRFPSDSSANKFLFNASRLSVGIAHFDQSIKLLDRIITNSPKAKIVPDCIFIKAFVYENNLKDMKNAFKFYTEFLTKYPTHELAPSAKGSLETLGVPAEALIKTYEQQKAGKTDTIKS